MLKKRQHNLRLFLEACEIVKNKQHTSQEGQDKLQIIKSQLSSQLSFEEKIKLPKSSTPLNAQKLTGFTDAEGHFSFTIVNTNVTGKKQKTKNSSANYYKFSFSIVQETSEIDFLKSIKDKIFLVVVMFTQERLILKCQSFLYQREKI
jgi:hypothetical protein